MINAIRLIGLACIVAAALTLALAEPSTLIALGVCLLIGLYVMGFTLCVFAGMVSRQDLDEANGMNHTDNLGNQN
jgi:hypothetical protein